ncbi:MAG: hypothetical protein P4L84_32155 [Isosphaeraceae bacterium]|nr:hypothetical protein [Isosphaeraceae bacterium]
MPLPRMTTRRWMIAVVIAGLFAAEIVALRQVVGESSETDGDYPSLIIAILVPAIGFGLMLALVVMGSWRRPPIRLPEPTGLAAPAVPTVPDPPPR